jgi:arsenate reductase
MAEAFWKHHGRDEWEVISAGTKPGGLLYPLAVQAMAERGIDISHQKCKSSDQFAGRHFDIVLTVCDNAEKECPMFPGGGERIHWPFDDPPHVSGTEADRLAATRRVRDEIEAHIHSYLSDHSDDPHQIKTEH